MSWRYKVLWSGGRIGSGVSVFTIGAGPTEPTWAAVNTAFRNWFTAIAVNVPNDVSWTFPVESESFNPMTGGLETVVPIPQAAGLVGGDASAQWAAPAGRMVRWNTGSVVGGRRLIGKTFIVPSAAGSFNEGSVTTGVRTADATAHTALLSALTAAGGELRIWSRKHGSAVPVTGGATLARPTTLRSRND